MKNYQQDGGPSALRRYNRVEPREGESPYQEGLMKFTSLAKAAAAVDPPDPVQPPTLPRATCDNYLEDAAAAHRAHYLAEVDERRAVQELQDAEARVAELKQQQTQRSAGLTPEQQRRQQQHEELVREHRCAEGAPSAQLKCIGKLDGGVGESDYRVQSSVMETRGISWNFKDRAEQRKQEAQTSSSSESSGESSSSSGGGSSSAQSSGGSGSSAGTTPTASDEEGRLQTLMEKMNQMAVTGFVKVYMEPMGAEEKKVSIEIEAARKKKEGREERERARRKRGRSRKRSRRQKKRRRTDEGSGSTPPYKRAAMEKERGRPTEEGGTMVEEGGTMVEDGARRGEESEKDNNHGDRLQELGKHDDEGEGSKQL